MCVHQQCAYQIYANTSQHCIGVFSDIHVRAVVPNVLHASQSMFYKVEDNDTRNQPMSHDLEARSAH